MPSRRGVSDLLDSGQRSAKSIPYEKREKTRKKARPKSRSARKAWATRRAR